MIEDGTVKEVHVEPDNTGISGTLAPKNVMRGILTLSSIYCGEGFRLSCEGEVLCLPSRDDLKSFVMLQILGLSRLP